MLDDSKTSKLFFSQDLVYVSLLYNIDNIFLT